MTIGQVPAWETASIENTCSTVTWDKASRTSNDMKSPNKNTTSLPREALSHGLVRKAYQPQRQAWRKCEPGAGRPGHASISPRRRRDWLPALPRRPPPPQLACKSAWTVPVPSLNSVPAYKPREPFPLADLHPLPQESRLQLCGLEASPPPSSPNPASKPCPSYSSLKVPCAKWRRGPGKP